MLKIVLFTSIYFILTTMIIQTGTKYHFVLQNTFRIAEAKKTDDFWQAV